jgi:hypothetical protein
MPRTVERTATAADLQGRDNARGRLLRLLLDREWHDTDAMTAAGGRRFSARLSELRGRGYEIGGEPVPGRANCHRYRLTRTPEDPPAPPVDQHGQALLFAEFSA